MPLEGLQHLIPVFDCIHCVFRSVDNCGLVAAQCPTADQSRQVDITRRISINTPGRITPQTAMANWFSIRCRIASRSDGVPMMTPFAAAAGSERPAPDGLLSFIRRVPLAMLTSLRHVDAARRLQTVVRVGLDAKKTVLALGTDSLGTLTLGRRLTIDHVFLGQLCGRLGRGAKRLPRVAESMAQFVDNDIAVTEQFNIESNVSQWLPVDQNLRHVRR